MRLSTRQRNVNVFLSSCYVCCRLRLSLAQGRACRRRELACCCEAARSASRDTGNLKEPYVNRLKPGESKDGSAPARSLRANDRGNICYNAISASPATALRRKKKETSASRGRTKHWRSPGRQVSLAARNGATLLDGRGRRLENSGPRRPTSRL